MCLGCSFFWVGREVGSLVWDDESFFLKIMVGVFYVGEVWVGSYFLGLGRFGIVLRGGEKDRSLRGG